MKLRRRRPVIEFVTDNERIRDMYPPVPAAKMLPEWYRQAKVAHEHPGRSFRRRSDLTIKGCPGIYDYLSLGYIVPLWADHILEAVDGGFSWEIDYPPGLQISTFPRDKWEGCPRQEGDHDHILKLSFPWEMRMPRGWSVMLVQPWYHPEDRWTVLPGVVDADILGTINLVAMWHLPKGEQTLVKAGTPLVHVIPFRRARPALSVIADQKLKQSIAGRGVMTAALDGNRYATGVYREQQRVIRDEEEKVCRS